MDSLTLAAAVRVVDATLTHAREIDCAPLAVAVVDSGGHVVALKREDGAAFGRNEIALGKARATLAMGRGGRVLEQASLASPPFFAAVASAVPGPFVPKIGGVLLRDAGGAVVGAVGVSGDTSEVDEECALAGIDDAGLVADAGT